MSSRWRVGIALILAFAGLIQLAGCDKAAPHKQATALTAAELLARPAHYGGDTEAWLTDRGGNNDGGYCAANLKLPLSTAPAWEYAYSAAEFSSQPAGSIVHYGGRLYLSAKSPQLVALDDKTGRVVLNKDVYAHRDTDSVEELKRIYAHPRGLLVGQDGLGRYYVWDITKDELPRLWVGLDADPDAGFVTDGTSLLTSWNNQLYGINVLDGKIEWQQPSLSDPGGVVVSRSGIEIWWSASEGRLYALAMETGALRWSISTTDILESAVIDDQRGLVYVSYGDEHLECRELESGTVVWQYSWRYLHDGEERQRRFQQVLDKLGTPDQNLGWSGTHNRLSLLSLMASGVALGLMDGSVITLDAKGKERWHYQGQAPVIRMLAFDNAVLVGTLYVRPEAYTWEQAVFCLAEPDWPGLKRIKQQEAQASKPPAASSQPEQSGQPPAPRQEMFGRFAALDIGTGTELSSFEPELFPISPLVPARSNIVYTEAPVYYAVAGASRKARKLRVLAYPWIDWEGD